ncbi:MAG: GntR family transcriptional regulator, partial [Candidatus Eremiobacterota bacterium]
MIRIQVDSTVPLVEQLQQELRRAIARGEVGPGDPLPPVRQLAADLGINWNTVARAYRALELEGLVSTARGRGT